MFVHYIFCRTFEFWTTKKNVYPHHLMEVPEEDRPKSHTFMQNHQFDLYTTPRKSRKAQPPKLSKIKEVTKGTTQGVSGQITILLMRARYYHTKGRVFQIIWIWVWCNVVFSCHQLFSLSLNFTALPIFLWYMAVWPY